MQLIGNTVYELLRHPDQLDLVRADPAAAGGAVEETLRYQPPVMSWPRSVLEPVSFGGHEVPVGWTVISVIGSANRDEAVFDRPDEFDVTRPAPRHLTFGGAVHHCLGAPLARMEAEPAAPASSTEAGTAPMAPIPIVRRRDGVSSSRRRSGSTPGMAMRSSSWASQLRLLASSRAFDSLSSNAFDAQSASLKTSSRLRAMLAP